MITNETLQLLKELAENNNREWFHANRAAFDRAQDNMTAFVGQMIGEIGRFDTTITDLEPRSCIFRIYRDIRFSKDKSPYKTHFGAYLAAGGRKSLAAGYYLHIEPNACFAAAGKYMPDRQELLRIRNAIEQNAERFKSIVETRAFLKRFGTLAGDSLIRPPKGSAADSPVIEYLKLKSFMVHRIYSDAEVSAAAFYRSAAADIKTAFPLVKFLRSAFERD